MKFRPEANIWPLMKEDELRDLAADIDKEGQRYPIYLYEGEILEGRNRYLAITRYCTKSREPGYMDVSPESPIAFAISHNEKRRHLNDSQRKMVAARALSFFAAEARERQAEAGRSAAPGRPSKKDEADPPQVSRKPQARDEAGAAFQVPGRGVEQAKRVQKKGSSKLIEAVDQGKLSINKAEEIIKTSPDKKAQDVQVKAIAESKTVSRTKALTGEVEWYTPRLYLDAVIEVMGAIDLDPASSAAAQEHVKAGQYFTMEEDGLKQQWHGRVFLNPPYSMPEVREFSAKLLTSYVDGDIQEGILLVNNATDTQWFQAVGRAADYHCCTLGRISFLQARDGELLEKTAPTHGQVFLYFGKDVGKFKEVFSRFGMTGKWDEW